MPREDRMSADRLAAAYRRAPVAAIADGREWYPAAYREAERIARPDVGITPERAAAVIAALSPRVGWAQNVAAAGAMIASRGTISFDLLPGFHANKRKARAIIRGGELGGPGDALGGDAPKVRAFWRAICGDPDAVVLDIWAMRAAGENADIAPRGARYERIAQAYRDAAEIVGESARDLQAILWLATRGLQTHARDVAILAQLELFRPDHDIEWEA
jgi:hypothetical protein